MTVLSLAYAILTVRITRGISGADPGFPVGEGANPTGKGRTQTYDFVKFSKKLHEIGNILGRRGEARAGDTPLDPALHLVCLN